MSHDRPWESKQSLHRLPGSAILAVRSATYCQVESALPWLESRASLSGSRHRATGPQAWPPTLTNGLQSLIALLWGPTPLRTPVSVQMLTWRHLPGHLRNPEPRGSCWGWPRAHRAPQCLLSDMGAGPKPPSDHVFSVPLVSICVLRKTSTEMGRAAGETLWGQACEGEGGRTQTRMQS